MNWVLIIWKVLLFLGVGQATATAEIPLGRADASHGRNQRRAPGRAPPNNPASPEVTSPPVNYWFKTGVVDENRGFMQGRAETKRGDEVVGSYQYSDGHVKVKVVYKADHKGYRILKEERVTLKPFTKPEQGKDGTKNKSVKNKAVLHSAANESIKSKQLPNGKFSSSYLSDSNFNKDTAFDLPTNHGLPHHSFATKPRKPQKYVVNPDNIGYPTHITGRTSSPTNGRIGDVLERPDRTRVSKRQKKDSNTRPPKRNPSSRTKVKSPENQSSPERLAMFYKDSFPLKSPLFTPEKSVRSTRISGNRNSPTVLFRSVHRTNA